MKLEKKFYDAAINHVVKNGDTDIFPYPIEYYFLKNNTETLSTCFTELDINIYKPKSLIDSLIPKSKYGFRSAQQPFYADTVIFTALVFSIFDEVEAGRVPANSRRAFSYRKAIGNDTEIFLPHRSYKDWSEYIESYAFREDIRFVVKTDISDYYARIYRHRLENILASLSVKKNVVKKIEKFISDWRGGQSFGIPVGTDAARLLAEAAFNDTDMALISEGIEHTRYVDDIFLFLNKDQDPYTAIAFLAKHLAENEGLSLNNQKTKVMNWDEFFDSLKEKDPEDESLKEILALERIFWATYGREEPSEEILEELTKKDLIRELEKLLAEPNWNMGAIRVIIHAMRLTKSKSTIDFICDEIQYFIPFAKDLFFLIQDYRNDGQEGLEKLSVKISDAIISEKMRPLDCARAWFLELGTRKILDFSSADVKRFESLTGTLDIRQTHLLRWRNNDINYFRSKKSKLNEIMSWAQPTFIFGARCLPRDEYTHWIRGIRSRLEFPFGKEFADWCVQTADIDPFQ
jgi:hypothetical protein